MRCLATHLITFAILAGAPLAAAQRSSPSAEADALFERGRRAMESGRFEEACAAFDASQKLAPAVTTLFNQAHCREQNQQLATALGLFREAERQTRTATDETARRLRQVAIDRIAQLEARVSTLTIAVAPAHRIAGLSITRGGVVLAAGAWNVALPIDGGTHAIVVRAPGHRAWTGSVTVARERDAKTLEVPALTPAPPEPEPEPEPSPARPQPTARSKLVPIVLGSAGLALLGGALGLDLTARSRYRDAEREPDRARQLALWKSARTRRYLGQGVAAAGLGCIGVGIWLYLRKGEVREDVVVVEPTAGAGSVGIQLTGRY